MQIELGQLGQGGLIEDIKPYDLPPNIFSDTLNVEYDGFVMKPMVSEIAALSPLPETREPIAVIQGFVAGDVYIYVAACVDSIWLWYMDEWFNITPVDAVDSDDWHLFEFNGYIILHSSSNYPYYLNPYDFHKPMEVIPSWPEGYLCQYLFGYTGFLIGLGLTSADGYFDRQLVFWSDISELGQLPSNFSFTDPASRSGFLVLEGAEDFICAESLQNFYVIYRSNSIFNLRFVGGNSVFAFERKEENTKLLNRNSVVEFDNVHFFAGVDSFFFYDGLRTQPAGEGKISRTFFDKLTAERHQYVQLKVDPNVHKVYIFYPTLGQTKCDRAYVFQYKKGLFFKREVPGAQAFTVGLLPPTGNLISWEDAVGTWADQTQIWEIDLSEEKLSKMVWFAGNLVYQIPDSGVYLPAYARRTDMAFAAQDQSGAVTLNRALRKMIKKVWPEVRTGQLNLFFGSTDKQEGTYIWQTPKTFDASTDEFQNHIINSKFIGMEINNYTDTVPSYFELTGVRIEIEPKGKY